eukprot:1124699-Pyramimonas_sp.AAC.1
MQWLLQEHKRRLDDNRAHKRARTLPSLSRLPLGFGAPADAAALASLRGLTLRTPRHFRPASAGTTLPPHGLADGRFGTEVTCLLYTSDAADDTPC